VDSLKFDELRDQVIDETIQKLGKPKPYTVIYGIGRDYVDWPDETDAANIKRWIETLENLR
jgi:hypothetical protein